MSYKKKLPSILNSNTFTNFDNNFLIFNNIFFVFLKYIDCLSFNTHPIQ